MNIYPVKGYVLRMRGDVLLIRPEGTFKRRKIRKLFHLEQGDVEFIRKVASEKKISESEVVREAIHFFQSKDATGLEYDPFAKLIGTVQAGSEQAARHDEVLYE